MVKIYVASFHRASDGAIQSLIDMMKEEDMYTLYPREADFILAVGDRIETFNFVLEWWRKGKKIIHLWAGEVSQGTHDEVYRHAITLMSLMQLCTNDKSKMRVKRLCKAVNKIYNVITVGNVMLDNLELDESLVPDKSYDVILYNPPTLLTREEIYKEIEQIQDIKKTYDYFWIEPNGDEFSDIVFPYQTHETLPREQFLGLLKNCHRFITNSSSEYYEAPFLMDKKNIIHIGQRNRERESKYANMEIGDANENIMKVFRSLNVQR